MDFKVLKNYKNKHDFSYMVIFRIGDNSTNTLHSWARNSLAQHVVPDKDVMTLLKGLGSRYKVIKRNVRDNRVVDKVLLDDFGDLMLLQLTYGEIIRKIYKLEKGPN